MKRALTLLLVLLLALSLCSCRRAPEETGETDAEIAAAGVQNDSSAPAEDNARNTEDGTESASTENDKAEPAAEKTPAPTEAETSAPTEEEAPAPTEEEAPAPTEAETADPEPEKPRGYVYTDTVAGFRVLPITKEIFEEAAKNTKLEWDYSRIPDVATLYYEETTATFDELLEREKNIVRGHFKPEYGVSYVRYEGEHARGVFTKNTFVVEKVYKSDKIKAGDEIEVLSPGGVYQDRDHNFVATEPITVSAAGLSPKGYRCYAAVAEEDRSFLLSFGMNEILGQYMTGSVYIKESAESTLSPDGNENDPYVKCVQYAYYVSQKYPKE